MYQKEIKWWKLWNKTQKIWHGKSNIHLTRGPEKEWAEHEERKWYKENQQLIDYSRDSCESTKKDKRKPLGKRCIKNIKSLQREVIQDGIIKMVTSTKLWNGPLQTLISWQKPWTMGRSCQNQFWENSEKQSKVYSSQTSTESRKRYHKMLTVTKIVTVTLCLVWWQSLSSSSHKVSVVLKWGQLVSPVWNHFPHSRGAEQTTFTNYCVCLF